MSLTLNTNTNFPPPGNPPYKLNREWCVGDSLGYINANTETFVNKCNELEKLTDISDSTSPLKKLNDILTTAPIFIPAGFRVNASGTGTSGNTNDNIQLENRELNSDTAEYSGTIKDWWSASYFVEIPNLGNTNFPPPTNTLTTVPRTVAVLVSVYFNTNSRGNNATSFYLKKRNTQANNDTYPTDTSNYIKKIQMDPTGTAASNFEAESDVTMVAYLDTNSPGIANTFSWKIQSQKKDNPWATGTYYLVRMNLLGYFVQYPSFVS